MKSCRKLIVLDEPTRSFLAGMRSIRLNAGLMLSDVAKQLGEPLGTVKMYEEGFNLPSLHMLLKLAELFGWDLSGSVNYKFFHRKVQPSTLKSSLKKYGLSYSEVARLTGYDKANVYAAVNMRSYGSVLCFAAVLEVIRSEEEAESLRRTGTRRKKGKCGVVFQRH